MQMGLAYNGCMSMKLLNTTGRRIRALREQEDINMNQDELARRLNVSNAFLSDIERDKKKLPLGMVIELARILRTTTDYLLLLTDVADVPPPPASTPAPYSAEAEAAARLLDSIIDDDLRELSLSLLQTVVAHAAANQTESNGVERVPGGAGARLILVNKRGNTVGYRSAVGA